MGGINLKKGEVCVCVFVCGRLGVRARGRVCDVLWDYLLVQVRNEKQVRTMTDSVV